MVKNMMNRKRSIAILFCTVCALLFAGCGNKNADAPDGRAVAETTGQQELVDSDAEIKEDDNEATESVKEEPEEKAEAPMEEEVDYDAIYSPVLSEAVEVIQKGYDYEKDYDYLSDGIIERVMYPGDDDLMQALGYVITDINDDGIKELMIGENADYEYDEITKLSFIYSGFTYKDDKIVCFLEGWGRNRQHYMGNGHFYNTGSNSAWSTIFGEWHLEPGGDSVTWDDFYFSEEDMATGGLAYFHNTTGVYDVNQAERMDIKDDDFYKIMDGYKCELISWTPIGRFAGNDQDAPAEGKLSQGQLRGVEHKLNADAYYGFMLSFYKDPRDINWHEVFYDGAGFDRGYPSDDIVKAYLKETGYDELMTDMTTVSGKDVKKFVKDTTGFDYSEMRSPLDWVYLKDYDLYVYEHGDTNRTQIDVWDGYVQNGVYIITYDNNYNGRGIVSYVDEGSNLRFISNQPEGSTLDPANGGDVDQSMLTDGMIIPDSDSRKLTEDDLKGLDADTLRIARNEIYARHGRKFTDKKLQEHFAKMPWYAALIEPEDFDEKVLNEIEKYNLELIGKLEKKKK